MTRDELVMLIGRTKALEQAQRFAAALEAVGGDAGIVRRAIQFQAEAARRRLDEEVRLLGEEPDVGNQHPAEGSSPSGSDPSTGRRPLVGETAAGPLDNVIPLRPREFHSVHAKWHALWDVNRTPGDSA